MVNERYIYFDLMKGIAIMGVVAIHTFVLNMDLYSIEGILLIIVRNIMGCCVPFFIAVSGFFLCRKQIDSKGAFKSFIRKRIKVVYCPMLLWGIPWLVLQLRSTHSLFGVCYTGIMYLLGGLSIFYFITLILECYILLPKIQKLKIGGVVTLLVFSIIVSFLWTLVNNTTDVYIPLIVYCSFPTYIGYFALGTYIGKTKKIPNLCLIIVLSLVGLILAIFESYYWYEYNPSCKWYGLKASVSLFSIGLILLIFFLKNKIKIRRGFLINQIEWIGNQTLPIYLSHMLVVLVIERMGFAADSWIGHCLVVFISDIFLIYVLNLVIPKKLLPYWGIR